MAKYIKKKIHVAFGALLLLFLIALAYVLYQIWESQQSISAGSIATIYAAIDSLQANTVYATFLVVILALSIWYLTIRTIKKPFKKITHLFQELDEGEFPEIDKDSPDSTESEMMSAVKRYLQRQKAITDFAISINSGNLKVEFDPAGPKDQLGNVLVHLKEKLLFNKIQKEDEENGSNEEVQIQKEKLEQQNQQIEAYFKQLSDSIKYAKKIQDAFLPSKEKLAQIFPRNFILYRPKEIVSGDFYWLEKNGNQVYIAAIDCFGQGVPGAFMTIVVANLLRQALYFTKEQKPGAILNHLDEQLKNILTENPNDIFSLDGVNISLCMLDLSSLQLQYSCANSPILLKRKNGITELRGSSKPIGQSHSNQLEPEMYQDESLQLKKGELLYFFSDGYQKQKNESEKEFSYQRLKKTLNEIAVLPMDEQREKISYTLIDWMREKEQDDDIMLIGIKI